ncbi:MAG TPA: CoA transferase [Rhodospirillales bacterium]|nr:CoA transferase [Rhodospirillales bacterium]
MAQGFLAGVRVLDLSQYLPGPMATRILADLGACVVKIEPPDGDPLLHLNPLTGQQESGIGEAYYRSVNAGKSVIRLDLKSAAGKSSFSQLIERADVLLESYRPGVMDRLGFGRDRLRDLNENLIHCALTGYGQCGPRANDAGHDIGYGALSGGMAASGTFNWPPVIDHGSAQQAAIAMLGALAGKERTGCFIDVSLTDSYLAWQEWGLTGAINGIQVKPGENLLNGGSACYRLYKTSDGRLMALGALEAKFWANFCRAVGKPDWIERQGEPLPQTALIDEVSALIAGHSLAHWTDKLSTVDCCFQAVLTYAETLRDETVRQRQLVQSNDGFVQVLLPAHFDGKAPQNRAPVRQGDLNQIIEDWS